MANGDPGGIMYRIGESERRITKVEEDQNGLGENVVKMDKRTYGTWIKVEAMGVTLAKIEKLVQSLEVRVAVIVVIASVGATTGVQLIFRFWPKG